MCVYMVYLKYILRRVHMKIAEALQLRADLQKRIEQLKRRLINNATVQAGEQPAEDPNELLQQLDAMLLELEALMTRINLTNATTMADGDSLTALIAKRDCLKIDIEAYRSVLDEASNLTMRVRGSEIIIKSTIPVAQLQKQVDEKSKALRILENIIQKQNWLQDLK